MLAPERLVDKARGTGDVLVVALFTRGVAVVIEDGAFGPVCHF